MSGTKLLVDVGGDGTAEYAHFDDDGNLTGLQWTNDVTEIIDANKAMQNDGTGGYGKTREWKRVGSIPISLVRQWEVELGVAPDFLLTREGFPVLLKKIKDPDYRHLRTDK